MENPLKHVTSRDWLYIGGAVASLVALAYLAFSNRVVGGASAITDIPNQQLPPSSDGAVTYTNYNMQPYNATPVPSGADMAPNPASTPAGCGCQSDCAGNGSLATGDTYSSVDQLINYYQNTNPIYVQLQQVMLQRYAAYFATGESYSKGGIAIGVSNVGSVSTGDVLSGAGA